MNPPSFTQPCVFVCLQVLGVRQANSAYHASAICVKHATEQLELLLRDIEALYGIGQDATDSFGRKCLLARKLVEKGVRFVQLYNGTWDSHDYIERAHGNLVRAVDRPIAALIADLERRGMLDDVLLVWGGEFGRTSMNEARGGSTYLGRDHHPHAFCMWMAGGGMKQGYIHGETDELGYKVASGKVTIRDLQATILDAVGLDPYRLRFPFQGLDQRLIGPTNEGQVQTALYR
jgi:hypothetical protein